MQLSFLDNILQNRSIIFVQTKKNIKDGTSRKASEGKLRLFCPINQRKTNISFSSFRGHFKEKKSSFYLLSWVLATKSEALRVMFSEAHKVSKVMGFPDKQRCFMFFQDHKVLKVMEFPDKQRHLCHLCAQCQPQQACTDCHCHCNLETGVNVEICTINLKRISKTNEK